MNGVPRDDLDTLATGHPELWRMLDGARLFLTGGTGFFGLWLVECALHVRKTLGLDLEITLLSRDPDKALTRRPGWRGQPGLTWLRGDVRNFTLPEGRFTHVLHAATDTSPEDQKDAAALLDIIVGGTRRVMEMAHRSGAQRVLFVSSGAVYGRNNSRLPITEGSTCTLDSMSGGVSYAFGKHFAEHLGHVAAAQSGIDFIVGRCFAFVGPGLPMNGHFAIGNFIHDALSASEIVVRGDGTPVRSYLYAADLCTWLYTLLIRAPSGRVYNVGSEQTLTIAELAHFVRDKLSPGKPVRILTPPQDGLPLDFYAPDTRRAQRELGLAVQTPLETAIRRTAQWLEAERASERNLDPNQQNSP